MTQERLQDIDDREPGGEWTGCGCRNEERADSTALCTGWSMIWDWETKGAEAEPRRREGRGVSRGKGSALLEGFEDECAFPEKIFHKHRV